MRRVVFSGLFFATALAAALLFGTSYAGQFAGLSLEEREHTLKESAAEAVNEAVARQDVAIAAISAAFEGIDHLTAAEESALRKYLNAEHLEKAHAHGVGRVSGATDVARLKAQGLLVRLEDSPYYYVQELTVSVPYVTPDTKVLLDKIGERFHGELRNHGLPLYRFVISSVLRTEATQAQLRRVNPNAANGVSTHEFGTTLDLLYNRFAYYPTENDGVRLTELEHVNERLDAIRVESYETFARQYRHELKGILGRVLSELQEEGDVVVIYERQQPVFHITLGRDFTS